MSNIYETQHGVTFNDKHTFRDYNLLPLGQPVITPAPPRTYYVEVPAANGSLDLTEALNGYVAYGNRQGTFEYQYYGSDRSEWYAIERQLNHDLHGKTATIILDDDPTYYYTGRVTINNFVHGNLVMRVKMTAVLSPYAYVVGDYSGNDWLWNPFDFDNGITREYYQIPVRGVKQITLYGSEMPVVPTFTVESGNLTLYHNGTAYSLTTGDNVYLDLLLDENNMDITLKGNGVITITYRIGGSI